MKTERERNLALLKLLMKLHQDKDLESIALLKTMVEKDTPAMQKSFQIMTQNTPLADFFGIETLSDLGKDNK
jgi:hypothetical protein